MPPITNQQIFDLLQEVKVQNNIIKTDIKTIKEDLNYYKGKIQDLEDKVSELEGENTNLQKRVKNLEESAKKNQIIVFGLEEETEELLEDRILHFLTNNLSTNISAQNIDNIYRIGKKGRGNTRPVIVRFVRYLEKQLVLRNANKLKGTGISISNDLTHQQQQEQKILYKYFRIAKSKGFPAKIIKGQLVVHEEIFQVNDLKEADEVAFADFFINKKGLFPNNSAPATPDSGDETGKKTLTQISPIPPTVKSRLAKTPRLKTEKKLRTQNKSYPTVSRIVTRIASGRTNSTSSSGKGGERSKKQ